MAHDVFISYSQEDKSAADAACATLEKAGVRCWIAPRDISPGAEWGEAIIEAINTARVMVLIFSSTTNESRQVRREVERAVSDGVTIMPIRIEQATPTRSLAYFMAGVHWLDALTPPLEKHLQQLSGSIKALLETGDAASAERAGEKTSCDTVEEWPERSTSRDAQHRAASAAGAADSKQAAAAGAATSRRNSLVAVLLGALIIVIATAGATIWALWPRDMLSKQEVGRTSQPPVSTAAGQSSFLQALSEHLTVAVPGLSAPAREAAVREYLNNPVHKALAVSLNPPGYWNVWNWATADLAIEAALEGCQVRHGHPCALIAKDDELQSAAGDGKLVFRGMPRVSYAGTFDPAQIPATPDTVRQRTDVVDYSRFAGPKAAAYHPMRGRLFVINNADGQHAAELAALKACNDDTALKKLSGPCFLYAVGNRVVLPLRLTEPLTSPPG